MWKKKFKKVGVTYMKNRGYLNELYEIWDIWILFSKSRGYLKIFLIMIIKSGFYLLDSTNLSGHPRSGLAQR